MKTIPLALFTIMAVFLGCAVAIDWQLLNPKYWSGILMTLLLACAWIAVMIELSKEK
jgi:hypothetical protein